MKFHAKLNASVKILKFWVHILTKVEAILLMPLYDNFKTYYMYKNNNCNELDNESLYNI